MRINITGEKELIQKLETTLKADKSVKTELPKYIGDRTELKFGIGEVATIVAIATGTAQLIEYLVVIASHINQGKTQKLQFKGALGTVTLDLHPDVTAAELQQLLKALEPKT
jgi:hypothetical protein